MHLVKTEFRGKEEPRSGEAKAQLSTRRRTDAQPAYDAGALIAIPIAITAGAIMWGVVIATLWWAQ